MAKKIQTTIKLQLPAGKATPAPPVGTALGPHGLNIWECAWLNQRESPAEFIASMGRVPDVRGAMHDILHPFADAADAWKQADAEAKIVRLAGRLR